jgi:hypothetical protein
MLSDGGTLPTLFPEWRYSTASGTEATPMNFLGSRETCYMHCAIGIEVR